MSGYSDQASTFRDWNKKELHINSSYSIWLFLYTQMHILHIVNLCNLHCTCMKRHFTTLCINLANLHCRHVYCILFRWNYNCLVYTLDSRYAFYSLENTHYNLYQVMTQYCQYCRYTQIGCSKLRTYHLDYNHLVCDKELKDMCQNYFLVYQGHICSCLRNLCSGQCKSRMYFQKIQYNICI